MSTETETPADTDDTSLDDFSAEFFGQDKAAPETTNPEVTEEVEPEVDAQTDEESQDDADDDADAVDDSDDNNDEESDEVTKDGEDADPKPQKKSRFQERIDELTNARREAERDAQALRDRLTALESKLNPETPTPAPKPAEGPTPPKPDDLNDDGSDKYPLGEFDPNFVADLADFRVELRLTERDQQAQEQKIKSQQQEAFAKLEQGWAEQLSDARERNPDYEDRVASLAPVFADIDQSYGEYLQTTLMSMDKGADVLYHLANNPEEARQIIQSGAQRATIALGRLEARFASEGETNPTPPRRTTNAPAPPPTNKGASAARGRVAPDTEDLDAFSAEFFKK